MAGSLWAPATSLNRTSVGLKLGSGFSSPGHGPSLNRTSVGLKPPCPQRTRRRTPAPQSNQRGIETTRSSRAARIRSSGLNRTSVGLKQRKRHLLARLWGGPQSNQRGIETASFGMPGSSFCRLNRTSVGLKLVRAILEELARFPGLNRTSVGLKHFQESSCFPGYFRPQSNQRGIETLHAHDVSKPSAEPQSNQRGIETEIRSISRA